MWIGLWLVIALLHLLSWCSEGFCDAYVTYVFPLWVNTYGRFSGLFPFSLGEWLIMAGVLVLSLTFMVGVAALILHIRRRKCPLWMWGYFRFFAWVLVCVALIMTLNCFLLYHVSSFSEKYLSGKGGDRSENRAEDTEKYTVEDLLRLYNQVVRRCNELSGQMTRDEQGYITGATQAVSSLDPAGMQDQAREEMRRLGETYPQLAGYYPRPKPLLSSDFLCQQGMLGWYFPFSMEANYNDVAYIMNQPATMCHELAHLKGFIYEDEANFIGYLACVTSSDPVFEYSGYLSVLGYVQRDLQRARKLNPGQYAVAVEKLGIEKPLDLVYQDDIFVTDEEWARIEGKALLDTETVSKATDAFVDTTLKANGVTDGAVSYSRVVQLMMEYDLAGGQPMISQANQSANGVMGLLQ